MLENDGFDEVKHGNNAVLRDNLVEMVQERSDSVMMNWDDGEEVRVAFCVLK